MKLEWRDVFDPRGRCTRRGLLLLAVVMLTVEGMLAGLILLGGIELQASLRHSAEVGLLWTAFAGASKRLHDCGHTAWWFLAGFVAVMVWCFVLTLTLVVTLGPEAMDPEGTWFIAALVASFLPVVAAALWLHLMPGVPAENAYGLAPGVNGFSRPAADTPLTDALRHPNSAAALRAT